MHIAILTVANIMKFRLVIAFLKKYLIWLPGCVNQKGRSVLFLGSDGLKPISCCLAVSSSDTIFFAVSWSCQREKERRNGAPVCRHSPSPSQCRSIPPEESYRLRSYLLFRWDSQNSQRVCRKQTRDFCTGEFQSLCFRCHFRRIVQRVFIRRTG